MDEHSHLERIRSSPGDMELLRDYAQWLSENDDPRGEYLEAELALRDTETRMRQLQSQMYELTVIQGLDLGWLDIVHPLVVTAPVEGMFHAASAPDRRPFIKPGDSCDAKTIVGILEVGGVSNKILAGTFGYVSEVVAVDGEPVACRATLVKLTRLPPPVVDVRQQ